MTADLERVRVSTRDRINALLRIFVTLGVQLVLMRANDA